MSQNQGDDAVGLIYIYAPSICFAVVVFATVGYYLHKILTARFAREFGDAWDCPECGLMVLGLEQRCPICYIYKTDWKCTSCSTHNKEENTKCFRCDVANPALAPPPRRRQRVAVVPAASPPQKRRSRRRKSVSTEPSPPPATLLNQNEECSICLDSKKDSAIYPCGHVCVCYGCGQFLQNASNNKCPICRSEIQDVILLYQ
jgi:protein neuralized